MEDPDEDVDAGDPFHDRSSQGRSVKGLLGPDNQPMIQGSKVESSQSRSPTLSSTSGAIKTLGNLFNHSYPERKDTVIRGGSRRGTRDYPHLPKDERELDDEERAALVENVGPTRMVEEEPPSAISEVAGSWGRASEMRRLLAESPRGPRPPGPRS